MLFFQIEKVRDSLLSDYEVLKHLDEIRESRDSSVRTLKAENVETIILEVSSYNCSLPILVFIFFYLEISIDQLLIPCFM